MDFKEATSRLYFRFRELMPEHIRIAIRDPDLPPGGPFVVVAMFNERNGKVAMRLVDPTYQGWTLDFMIENAANEMGDSTRRREYASFGEFLGKNGRIKWKEATSLS
jgi:hypothetical protein